MYHDHGTSDLSSTSPSKNSPEALYVLGTGIAKVHISQYFYESEAGIGGGGILSTNPRNVPTDISQYDYLPKFVDWGPLILRD